MDLPAGLTIIKQREAEMTEPLTLFIETIGPFGYQIHPHSFHLGTNERLARQIAEEMFNTKVYRGMPIVTVALRRKDKVVSCYDGTWMRGPSAPHAFPA